MNLWETLKSVISNCLRFILTTVIVYSKIFSRNTDVSKGFLHPLAPVFFVYIYVSYLGTYYADSIQEVSI